MTQPCSSGGADPRDDAPFRLITIPFSHFAEKARWALDRLAIPYREEPHLPLAHAVPAMRAGGRRTVPVLVSRAGAFADSTAILRYLDRFAPPGRALFPEEPALAAEVAALEDRFDRTLGPAARRVAYHHVLPDADLSYALMSGSFGPGRSRFWLRRPFFRVYAPIAGALMKRGLGIDAAGEQRSRAAIRAVFDEVSALLRDGRPYLTGPRFTAADLTFAALASPVIAPPEHPIPMPALDAYPSALRDLMASYRAEPAGAFALRMYREHRAARA